MFAPPINRLITELARFPGIGQRTAQRLAFHILRASDEEALALADAIREVKEKVGQCEICFNLATEPTCRICQDDRRDAHVICVVEEPSDVIPIERTNEFSGKYHVLGGALSPIDGVDPEDLHVAELLERAAANGIREVKETVGHCEVCFNLAVGPRCRICEDERRDGEVICVVEEPSDVIPVERTHEFSGRYHVLGGALSPIDGVDPGDLRIAELVRRVEGGAIEEVIVATNSTTTGEATALYLADTMRERAPQVSVTRLASGLPVGADLEYADEVTLGIALTGRRAL